MKRARLLKFRYSLFSAVLIAALASGIQPPVAQAAIAGSGTCAQTVDSSAGVSVYQDTNHCYVAFKNAATYVWSPAASVRVIDLLVVAGGGGGGSRHAGGGGAGGVINLTSLSINGTDVSLTVGAGGAGGLLASSGGNNGSNGSNSQVSGGGLTTRIAIGGGGGGYGGGTNSGGSGAGGGSSGAGGANTAGQGFPGSAGITDNVNYWVGGGGGGAGETGTASTSSKAGSGGRGTAIAWLTADASNNTGVGVASSSQFFVGGGGGGGSDRNGIAGGDAGLGGGAAGSTGTASAGNATTNSGGGGGGSGISGSGTGSFKGGDGGRGVILIRFLIDQTAPSFTNGTSFSFAENTATSSNAATITVSESSTVTLNASGDHLLFTVVTSDSTTARIRFISSPNFESAGDSGANNVYDLSVRATDTFGNFANQSIAITITNVNEAPTITTASSAATHTITQAENSTSVVTYTGSDVDAGTTLTWSISGTDAADFSINSSSGVLAFSINPDFEAPADSDTNNAYIVVITLSDGSLTDTQTVTITITNANESASINAPTVSGTINKGINTTITVTINVAGKVRFFVGNKRISTCKERTTSGTYPNNTATCTWKPAVTGRQFLTATLTPTDNTFSPGTSAATTVQVVRRSSTR